MSLPQAAKCQDSRWMSAYTIPTISIFVPISSRSIAIRLSSRDDKSALLLVAVASAWSKSLLAFFSATVHISLASAGEANDAVATSASFSSSTAISNSDMPPTHVLVTNSAWRLCASSKNARAGIYSPAVRWTIPRRRERIASSSGLSRSTAPLGEAGVGCGDMKRLWMVTAGVREAHSLICALDAEFSIRASKFQTVVQTEQIWVLCLIRLVKKVLQIEISCNSRSVRPNKFVSMVAKYLTFCWTDPDRFYKVVFGPF